MILDPVPILPLDMVLFPRMPLPLQVSTDPYAAMVARCAADRTPFGVVLAPSGVSPGDLVPGTVGTLANIHAAKRISAGKVSIFAVGADRFRVVSYLAEGEPYPQAVVEAFDDQTCEPRITGPLVADVQRLFSEYFRSLVDQAGVDMPSYDLPEDPVELSFVIAAVVQADSAERQALLETTDTAERLSLERTMLEQGNALVREIAQPRRLVARRLSALVNKPKLSRN